MIIYIYSPFFSTLLPEKLKSVLSLSGFCCKVVSVLILPSHYISEVHLQHWFLYFKEKR